MTSFESFPSRNRDMQDFVERHVYGKVTHESGSGSFVTVRGNGTQDEEVPVLAMVNGMALPENTNAEVLLFAGGSDTNMKFALLQIPRDKVRAWREGTGGVQSPTDPNRFMEFNEKRVWLNDGNFAFAGGTFEIKNGKAYFRCPVVIDGPLTVNGGITTPNVSSGSESVPGFEE